MLCRLSGTEGGVALQNPLEEVSRGCVRRGRTAMRTKEVRVKNEIARDRRVTSCAPFKHFLDSLNLLNGLAKLTPFPQFILSRGGRSLSSLA